MNAMTRTQKDNKVNVSLSGGNAGRVCQDQLMVIEHDATKMRTEMADIAPE
jgi:hypothetical protein